MQYHPTVLATCHVVGGVVEGRQGNGNNEPVQGQGAEMIQFIFFHTVQFVSSTKFVMIECRVDMTGQTYCPWSALRLHSGARQVEPLDQRSGSQTRPPRATETTATTMSWM